MKEPIDSEGRLLRTQTRETAAGFCSECGIIRQDVDGIPVNDCVCTAQLRHKTECFYVAVVAMPVAMDIYCSEHLLEICEDCDCDCGYIQKT